MRGKRKLTIRITPIHTEQIITNRHKFLLPEKTMGVKQGKSSMPWHEYGYGDERRTEAKKNDNSIELRPPSLPLLPHVLRPTLAKQSKQAPSPRLRLRARATSSWPRAPASTRIWCFSPRGGCQSPPPSFPLAFPWLFTPYFFLFFVYHTPSRPLLGKHNESWWIMELQDTEYSRGTKDEMRTCA